MSVNTIAPTLTVQLQPTDDFSDLELPSYAQPGDAGVDLRTTHDLTLEPGERRIAHTGLRIALPEGFAAFVHPRSGLAAKHGLTVVNSPGTIDAGYRGELLVILLNTDKSNTLAFKRGDRIAQLVNQRVETVRGGGGLGSTGGFNGAAIDVPASSSAAPAA